MTAKKISEYVGTSQDGLSEALSDALSKAGKHRTYKVIETTKSLNEKKQREYQVTVSTQL